MNPVLALIIANLIWGAASPIFKYALTNIPPFTLAFIRFFFAALLFLPFVRKSWFKTPLRDFIEICVSAFFGITVNIAAFFLGLQRGISINAPIIGSSGPIFIYFFSILFLREKPRLRVFAGMMIALAGVLGIILSPVLFDGKVFGLGEMEGNLFFVLAMLGAVIQAVMNKSILRRHDVYKVSAIGFLFGSLPFLLFVSKELSSWSFSQLQTPGWVGIIFGVFLCSALAYFLFNYGIQKLKAQEVGLFTYIDPIVAVLIAIPLVKEYPDLYFFIGSVLVFGGIYLAEGRVHWHPFHKIINHKIQRSIE